MTLLKGALRLSGFALSLLLYSYLELIDLGPTAGSADVPPSLIRSYVNMLPLVIGLGIALLLVAKGIKGASTFAFVGLLILSALRTPNGSNPLLDARAWPVPCFAAFVIAAAVVWSSPEVMASGDDFVRFEKYEQEIRQLMLRYEPENLHMVDNWLSGKYKRRGHVLLRELQEKYKMGGGSTGGKPSGGSSSASSSAPKKTAEAPKKAPEAHTHTSEPRPSSQPPSSSTNNASAAAPSYAQTYPQTKTHTHTHAHGQQAAQARVVPHRTPTPLQSFPVRMGRYGLMEEDDEEADDKGLRVTSGFEVHGPRADAVRAEQEAIRLRQEARAAQLMQRRHMF